MSREIDIADANDALQELANRPNTQPERQLWYEVLHSAWLDLNKKHTRTKALLFFNGESCKEVCRLLSLDYEDVQCRANNRPFKPQQSRRGGVRGPRKRKPIIYSHTFNSSEAGVSSNDEHSRSLSTHP